MSDQLSSTAVSFDLPMDIGTITRTLLIAGYSIVDVQRNPEFAEFYCNHTDAFGASIPYLFIFCERDTLPTHIYEYATRKASTRGAVRVFIAENPGESWLGWNEFLQILGGAVPNWRALGPSYSDAARKAAKNEVPEGMYGEAWAIFESIVADGLEFIFGCRVRRLGNKKRGVRVADMITQTPDKKILVVDTKASETDYSVGFPDLRPLVEYIGNQRIRQQGALPVSAAILVADNFEQNPERLQELSGEFLAEASIPLAFVKIELLINIVSALSLSPTIRNSIRWARIFCKGGLATSQDFERERARTESELYHQ